MKASSPVPAGPGLVPRGLADQLLRAGREHGSMKLLMVVGGGLGFVIGLGFGLAQQSQWPTVVWRSSLTALAAGLLLRWWGAVWARSLYEVRRERQAALETEPASPLARTKV